MEYHISVETVSPLQDCPACNSDQAVGFGRHQQLIHDLPIHAKRVGVYVDTRRFRCRACGRTYMERLPSVDSRRAMTIRLIEWIGKTSLKRTFAEIAGDVGIDEKTVRNVFGDHVGNLEKTVRFEVPRYLGIDEIHLIKPRCVLTNIENKTAVEILPERNKKSVIRYLLNLKGRENVKLVAMDMWRPYREAISETIPNATVIIDKFHVLRMANDAMERVRKEIRKGLTSKQRRGLMHDRFLLLKRGADIQDSQRKTLEGWISSHPALGDAYRAKESFFEIYDTVDRREAFARYVRWRNNLAPGVSDAFSPHYS